jgi:zinc transport system substrate-binding protein
MGIWQPARATAMPSSVGAAARRKSFPPKKTSLKPYKRSVSARAFWWRTTFSSWSDFVPSAVPLKGQGDLPKGILSGLGLVFCVMMVLTACNSLPLANQGTDGASHKIRVITTLFPLYDMAKFIAADTAEVSLLLPPGVEAHSFEPKPTDLVRISEADVFVYTGNVMEPWVNDVIRSAGNQSLVVVDASQGTTMIPGIFRNAAESAGSLDPHIWLDFDNAKMMVSTIEQALETKNPISKALVQQNAGDYRNRLTALDTSYRTTLATAKIKEIVYAGHYAFGYLAHRYGLGYLAAQGVSPDSEPTANDLAQLVEQVRKDQIQYIFYEELTSPKIAETLARETNAKLLLLNAAHNLTKQQFEQGVTFFDILRSNLENLRVGLECQSP